MSDEIKTLLEGFTPKTPFTFLKKSKQKRQSMTKNIRKTLRFSEDEFEKIQIELDKSNITFSDFARSAILKKKIKLPIEKELIYQISKIGNNLNQIARAVNQEEKKLVLIELIEIEKELKAIRNVR